MSNKYDESSIKQLSLIEGVRLRPSTFINGVGPAAILQMLKEIIQNANDEVSNGYATKIDVEIDSKTPEIIVTDNGRGIPIGSIDVIMDNIYSGGKYNENSYGKHNGSNGMGLCVLRCISDYMELQIKRDGKICDVRYENGKKVKHEVKEYKGKDTGTKVVFKPFLDPFFGEEKGIPFGNYIDHQTFDSFITGIMYSNKGVIINTSFDGLKKVYFFNGTDEDYLNSLAKKEKAKFIYDSVCVFSDKNENTHMNGKVVLSFTREPTNKIWSYVEGFPTVEDGTHVDGTRAGISRAITQYIKQNDLVPKSAKFTVTGADIIDNIFMIVMIEMRNPLYDAQTKNRLTSKDAFEFMSTMAYSKFTLWAKTHKDEMDKLCKWAIIKAKAAYAAKEAKEQVMNPVSTKNIVSSKLNFKNFTDCSGNNPKENELYLCEGLSASTALVQCRDSKTQAYLALRGKILNIEGKKNPTLTEELQVLISILGIKGRGENADYSKLRYYKIVILSDSDDDGAHIYSLICSFFLNYYPKIIEDGHLFRATPPFYRLNYPHNIRINILNETYFGIYKIAIALYRYDLLDAKNKKIDKNVFKVFLNKLINYNSFLDIYAKELNLDPNLLEIIVRSFDHLIAGKYKQFEKLGYIVHLKTSKKNYRTYYFDKGYNHYFLQVDSKFFNDIYKPIYKRLCEIKLGNVKFQDKITKTIYDGTLYHLALCLDKMLIGSKCKLERYKGIGEMNPDALGETAMNPKTRKLVQVTIKDAQSMKNAKFWNSVLMGNSNMSLKKDVFMNNCNYTNDK